MRHAILDARQEGFANGRDYVIASLQWAIYVGEDPIETLVALANDQPVRVCRGLAVPGLSAASDPPA